MSGLVCSSLTDRGAAAVDGALGQSGSGTVSTPEKQCWVRPPGRAELGWADMASGTTLQGMPSVCHAEEVPADHLC